MHMAHEPRLCAFVPQAKRSQTKDKFSLHIHTQASCCATKTGTDKCWFLALIVCFTLRRPHFVTSVQIQSILVHTTQGRWLKYLFYVFLGFFLNQQSPVSNSSNTHTHTRELLGSSRLLSFGQQPRCSSRGLAALFKHTWIVENKGGGKHGSFPRYLCEEGPVSVCEFITSGFCCFSISGMEITEMVNAQSMNIRNGINLRYSAWPLQSFFWVCCCRLWLLTFLKGRRCDSSRMSIRL